MGVLLSGKPSRIRPHLRKTGQSEDIPSVPRCRRAALRCSRWPPRADAEASRSPGAVSSSSRAGPWESMVAQIPGHCNSLISTFCAFPPVYTPRPAPNGPRPRVHTECGEPSGLPPAVRASPPPADLSSTSNAPPRGPCASSPVLKARAEIRPRHDHVLRPSWSRLRR